MGIIRRTFDHLDHKSFSLLCKSLVRPHLEVSNSAWVPHLKKDIELISPKKSHEATPQFQPAWIWRKVTTAGTTDAHIPTTPRRHDRDFQDTIWNIRRGSSPKIAQRHNQDKGSQQKDLPKGQQTKPAQIFLYTKNCHYIEWAPRRISKCQGCKYIQECPG